MALPIYHLSNTSFEKYCLKIMSGVTITVCFCYFSGITFSVLSVLEKILGTEAYQEPCQTSKIGVLRKQLTGVSR